MNRFVFAFACGLAAVTASAEFRLTGEKSEVALDDKANLISLKCRGTGWDWAGGAPLWRMYFDRADGEKEIPIDATCGTPKVSCDGRAIRVAYDGFTVRGKPFAALLELAITLDGDGPVRFAVKLTNDEPHTIIRELQYPLVGDLRRPADADLFTTHAGGQRHRDPVALVNASNDTSPYMGRNWQFRQLHLKYPELTAANCFAFLAPREGLYFAAHDASHRDTWHGLRTYPNADGEFNLLEAGLYKYPQTVAGGVWSDDTHVVYPYAGTWHVTADTYRKWANTWWRQRKVPDWVRAMPGWQRIVFRHQYGVTYYTPDDVNGRIREAGESAGVNALLAFGWWKAGMDNGYPDSYFTCDPAWGGDEGWKRTIAAFKANGGRFIQYFNGKLIDLASDFWKSGKGKRICYRDNLGEVFTEHYRFSGPGTFTGHWNSRLFTVADQRSEEWRAIQRKYVDRALDFGADAVFFDQMGYAEESCNWDNSGEFPVPHQGVIAEKAESLRRIHDYMDTKGKPDFALGTELFADVCAQHVDFVHNIHGSRRKEFFMDWIRYAFPEVVLSDREIRDDTDIPRRLNLNLLVGIRSDIEIYRCQGLISMTPTYQRRLCEVNRLRSRYPVLLATYRDTLGFSNSDPEGLNARLFTDGKAVAIVACTYAGRSGAGIVSVPGRKFVSSDGIGGYKVSESGGGIHVNLEPDSVVVLAFE